MKVRIREALKERIRQSVTGCISYDSYYIAEVKEHWWTAWEFVYTEGVNNYGEHTHIRLFESKDEVKDYIKEQYLNELCKVR